RIEIKESVIYGERPEGSLDPKSRMPKHAWTCLRSFRSAPLIFGLFWVSCEEVWTTKDLAWRSATKIRIISRKDAKAAKKQNRFPNLAFLAPWSEDSPNPIKNLRFSRKFES